jgi:hypothetical protein
MVVINQFEHPDSSIKGDIISLNPYASNMEIQYANNYHIQNEMLKNFKDTQSTYETKVTNLQEQTYNLNWYNLILVIIYGVFSFMFIVFSFVGKKMSDWSFLLKIVMAAVLVLFPFFITLIQQIFMQMFSYILNFINGSVYIKPSF